MRNRQQFEQLVFEKAEEKKLCILTPLSARTKYVSAAAAAVIVIGLGTGLYFYNAKIPLSTHDSDASFDNNNNINNVLDETSRYAENTSSVYENTFDDKISQPESANRDNYQDNMQKGIPDYNSDNGSDETSRYVANTASVYENVFDDEKSQPEHTNGDGDNYQNNMPKEIQDFDGIETDAEQFPDRIDYTVNDSTVQITDTERVENVKKEVMSYIYYHDGRIGWSSSDVDESPEIMLCRLDAVSYETYSNTAVKTTVWVYPDHIHVESESYLYNSDGELTVHLPRYEDVEVGGYYILTDEFVQMIKDNIDENFTV